MQHPKVVILGAGSLFFGRQAIWQMVHSTRLQQGTLALVDTNPQRLNLMADVARKVVAQQRVPLKIEASTDRRQVLDGADYVVLSFAKDTVRHRGIDCAIAEKYGVRMCSGDTIGPGGIFRACREVPDILAVCDDVTRQCPQAWVINYINPSSVGGIALRRFAPHLKSFALCDGPHMPHLKRRYAHRAGVIADEQQYDDDIARRFDFRVAGVNHFSWLVKAEFDGRDVVPQIAAWLKEQAVTETTGGDTGAKAKFNQAITYQLYEIFGTIPTCTAHTKEYVRFWQGLGRTPEPIPPLSIWETEARYQRHQDMWDQVAQFADGRIPIERYMSMFGPDHATDIIESLVADDRKTWCVNTFNDGAVTNMPQDAFLELMCTIEPGGIRTHPVGEMPLGPRGLCQQVLDTHELTALAAGGCDRALLRRAMLTDPMISSIADADAMISEFLAAEREALPARWY